MGWKTSAILFDGHHPGGERALLEALGYTAIVAGPETTVEDAFYPEGLFVGRFEDLTLLFDDELPMRVLEDPVAFEGTLAKAGPFPTVLVVGLHSVTNFYGYAWFQDGKLIRSAIGSGADGTHDEDGARLPFEERVLATYTRREEPDGTAVYSNELDEFTIDALGEEIVFAGMAELLGFEPDGPDGEALFEATVTRYEARSPGAKTGAGGLFAGLRTFMQRMFGS